MNKMTTATTSPYIKFKQKNNYLQQSNQLSFQFSPQKTEWDSESLFGNQKLSQYDIGKKLGQGAYAIVKLGTDKETYRQRVLKIYEKYKLYSKSKRKNVINEIRNLKHLTHENIVKFITAINTKKQIIIVTEYQTKTTLAQYLNSKGNNYYFSERSAIKIFKQIVSAISYMHTMKIAHRDIKLENILIDPNRRIKLIDFGFSINFQRKGRKCKLLCGTPCYMAPELVGKKQYDPVKVDVWALGVVFYRLLFGLFPFTALQEAELFKRIKSGIFNLHKTETYPKLGEFLKVILRVNPEERPTASQVTINNPFQQFQILQKLNDFEV